MFNYWIRILEDKKILSDEIELFLNDKYSGLGDLHLFYQDIVKDINLLLDGFIDDTSYWGIDKYTEYKLWFNDDKVIFEIL